MYQQHGLEKLKAKNLLGEELLLDANIASTKTVEDER